MKKQKKRPPELASLMMRSGPASRDSQPQAEETYLEEPYGDFSEIPGARLFRLRSCVLVSNPGPPYEEQSTEVKAFLQDGWKIDELREIADIPGGKLFQVRSFRKDL